MNYTKTLKLLFLTSTCALTLQGATPTHAGSIEDLVVNGKFFGEMRARYEAVEQDGFTTDADAYTMRTNAGFKTGTYNNFQALMEVQMVQSLGTDDYNSTTNGLTNFPTVADPNGVEINELWVSWGGVPNTVFKLGRQKINLDNQRFVGTVGWRQNDQTYDALRLDNDSIDNLHITYTYARNINRIFGEDSNLGDLDSKVHLANLSYKFSDWLKLTGYAYLLEFDRLAARSSKTFGARAAGKAPLSEDWTFSYEAEFAAQEDYKNNTANYDEDYYHIAPSISGHGFTFKAGYEVLEGDGTNAFQTPLATGHKFNGWADAFLNTPNGGLQDAYVSASYKFSGSGNIFDGTKVAAIYHDFDSNDSGTNDYGEEINYLVTKSFKLRDDGQPFDKINVVFKYADFDSDSTLASREKWWLQLGIKF